MKQFLFVSLVAALSSLSAEISSAADTGLLFQLVPFSAFRVNTFTCDGREYCSQMTSCDEALFFLNNCPNVKMDGDNDGIPCEGQWCEQ